MHADSVLREICLNCEAAPSGLERPVDELFFVRSSRSVTSKNSSQGRPVWKPSGHFDSRSLNNSENARIACASSFRGQKRQRSAYRRVPGRDAHRCHKDLSYGMVGTCGSACGQFVSMFMLGVSLSCLCRCPARSPRGVQW